MHLRSCSTRINMDNRRLSFVENIFIGSSIFWTRFGPTNENNAVRVCWHDNTIIQMYKAKKMAAAIWKVKRQTFSKTKSTIKTTSFRADLRRVFCAFLPRDPDHVLLCVISLARLKYLSIISRTFFVITCDTFWLFYSGLYSSSLPGPRPGLEGGNVSLRGHVLIAADVFLCFFLWNTCAGMPASLSWERVGPFACVR